MVPSSLGLALWLALAAEPSPDTGAIDPTLTVSVPEGEAFQVKPPQGAPLAGEFGARTELRAGQPLEVQNPGASTDLTIDPIFALRYLGRTGGITVAYEPRIFLSSYGTQKAFYLHRLRLNSDVKTSPRMSLFVNARGSFGQNDFSPLVGVGGSPPTTGVPVPPAGTPTTGTGTVPPSAGTLPDVRFIDYVESEGSVGFTYNIAQPLDWTASAGYQASGGLRPEDRATLPLQQGPIAQTRLHWTVSPRDRLEPILSVSHLRFTGAPGTIPLPSSTVGDLVASWTRGWSPGFVTTLAGGISGFHVTGLRDATGNPLPPSDGVRPAAAMVIGLSLDGRGTTWHNELQARITPGADRLTGIVHQTFGGLLFSRLGIGERWSFTVSGEGTATQDSLQREARLEGRVTYLIGREFEASLGSRAAWVKGSNLLGAPASQWSFGWTGFLDIAAFLGSDL